MVGSEVSLDGEASAHDVGLRVDWPRPGMVPVRCCRRGACPSGHRADLLSAALSRVFSERSGAGQYLNPWERRGSGIRRWLMAGVLCAALDLPLVLTQYAVSEALYGIDDSGGPYATE